MFCLLCLASLAQHEVSEVCPCHCIDWQSVSQNLYTTQQSGIPLYGCTTMLSVHFLVDEMWVIFSLQLL